MYSAEIEKPEAVGLGADRSVFTLHRQQGRGICSLTCTAWLAVPLPGEHEDTSGLLLLTLLKSSIF